MEGYQGSTDKMVTSGKNGEQDTSNEAMKQVVYVPESHGNPTQMQAMIQQGNPSPINSNKPSDIPSDNAPPAAYTNNLK